MATAPERRILIVDDEPNLVDAVRLYLEMEGYIALSATSGGEALVKLRELPDAQEIRMLIDFIEDSSRGLCKGPSIRRQKPIAEREKDSLG